MKIHIKKKGGFFVGFFCFFEKNVRRHKSQVKNNENHGEDTSMRRGHAYGSHRTA